MSGKFIITITGPIMMYRLDLIKRASPSIIKNNIIIFTDDFSLKIYKEKGYDKDFNFVSMDEIRKNYPISLKHELLLNVDNEEEYFDSLINFKFYSRDKKLFYPFDIQRFIFPYLIENNILNFVLIDSDFMFYNDESLIEKFFNRVPSGVLHTVFQGDHPNRDGFVKFFNELVIPNFKQIDFPTNDFKMGAGDGFFRGFHFKNIQDMKLFFEVWNQTIEKLFTSEKYNFYVNSNIQILDTSWICPFIMQYFKNIGYKFHEYAEYTFFSDFGVNIGRHLTRPEDTFYIGKRWVNHDFVYDDIKTISDFIKKNKKPLTEYYNSHVSILEITDTHVYTTTIENVLHKKISQKKYEKIWVIGDSHANTFHIGHPKIRTLNVGPITMYRVGKVGLEENFDNYYIPRNELSREGLWVLAFGEIDCRCHIWNQINLHGRDEDEVISTLVTNYFISIKNSNYNEFAVMSVVPAIKYHTGDYDYSRFQEQYPVIGLDTDRLRYVEKMNNLIKNKCEENNYSYIDVHSLYCDSEGYMIKELSDGEVHIYDRGKLFDFFEKMGLL